MKDNLVTIQEISDYVADHGFMNGDKIENELEAAKHWLWEVDYRVDIWMSVLKEAMVSEDNSRIKIARENLIKEIKEYIEAERIVNLLGDQR